MMKHNFNFGHNGVGGNLVTATHTHTSSIPKLQPTMTTQTTKAHADDDSNPSIPLLPSSPSTFAFEITGKILRRKKISSALLMIAIQDDREKIHHLYVNRNNPPKCNGSPELNIICLEATITVQGNITKSKIFIKDEHETEMQMVEKCALVKCAPDAKMIKEVFSLPNFLIHAKSLGAEHDLEKLLAENSQRVVILNLIRRLRTDDGDNNSNNGDGGQPDVLRGKKAKGPRYRRARLNKDDLDILDNKEAEGQDEAATTNTDNQRWKICIPCNSLSGVAFNNPKKETVVNLPNGAENVASAHGELTRTEYLENKKNNQTMWFIERMRQFKKQPRKILDVGGGRGDLAVQIALNFPDVHVIVVDSNKSSVLAGQEYAVKCNVDSRTEFLCQNFSDYVTTTTTTTEQQNSGNAKDNAVDFVVALHACGDLSDMALHFASINQCDFIICPCCYPKRYLAPFIPLWHTLCSNQEEINTLARIVELDDWPEESWRAMVVINSMRRSGFDNQNVKLEAFDNKISRRNIALVGEIPSNHDK